MSRYAEAHKPSNLAGAGDARPTALQIIRDENLMGKLSDKVFLVTGVSSGIGIETLRALHATGAHVYGTVRSLTKGQKVADEILAANPNGGKIDLIEMELTSLSSVRAGAEDFLAKSGGKLNVLIANAGIMATPFVKTKDGFESQFATNHLAHFLLFQLVKPALLASASAAFPSRVVSVTSIGHRFGRVRFSDYNFANEGEYNDWAAYGQSKTANIYFASYIDRQYAGQHLRATSVHPGGIMTNLGTHLAAEDWAHFTTPEWMRVMKSAEQGAATQVLAAVGKEWEGKGGKYLANCVEQPPFGTRGLEEKHDDGYAEWVYDVEGEVRLWKDSLDMVGLEGDGVPCGAI
jgi:NAD(P)-dependent dehydrogenase (short-subunit alcohol dehydrogenase family)